MHFSRSPFMALAVTAMIGRCFESFNLADGANRGVTIHRRQHDIHQHESMSVLIQEHLDAVFAVFGGDDVHLEAFKTLVMAKMLRISSSTISTSCLRARR